MPLAAKQMRDNGYEAEAGGPGNAVEKGRGLLPRMTYLII